MIFLRTPGRCDKAEFMLLYIYSHVEMPYCILPTIVSIWLKIVDCKYVHVSYQFVQFTVIRVGLFHITCIYPGTCNYYTTQY